MTTKKLSGRRFVLRPEDADFPVALKVLANQPECLFGIGDPKALNEGLAVVGARKATPYGLACAKRFASAAARRKITVISGGARGCDAASHRAALEAGGLTVAFLGGGCDEVYPRENFGLFQEIIDSGGCIVSENAFDSPPLPWMFRERNRLIAGLAKATLIVEAGLPSGTFSTADEALAANREVLVVPGSITSERSRGANRLIYQGATPIVDDDSFADQLFSIFGELKQEDCSGGAGLSTHASSIGGDDLEEWAEMLGLGASGPSKVAHAIERLLEALDAEPLGLEELNNIVHQALGNVESISWLMVWLSKMQSTERIARYPDGRYGPSPQT